MNNTAFCLFNLELFNESIQICNSTINLDSKHSKAIFRRASAYIAWAEKLKAINNYNDMKGAFDLY